MKRLSTFAVGLWLPAVLLVAWWFLSGQSNSLQFPALSEILSAVERLWIFDRTISDLLPSLRNLLAGFLIAVFVGAVIGLLLGSLPRLFGALSPEIEFLRSLPSIAILPVAILAFGLGDGMRVFVIAFGAFWPVLLNTIYAVRGMDPTALDVERSFVLTAWTRFAYVRLPAALPGILAGARVSLFVSMTLLVVSEVQGSGIGIGFFLLASQRSWAVVDMWSGMVVLGIVGYVLSLLFRLTERGLLRNYPTPTKD